MDKLEEEFKEFDNIGFKRDCNDRIMSKIYPNGHEINVNRCYGYYKFEVVNRSLWQRIKCRLWTHQHNNQINYCLSCGKHYMDYY